MADQHATLLDSSDSIFQSVKTSEEKPVINMTLDEFKNNYKMTIPAKLIYGINDTI